MRFKTQNSQSREAITLTKKYSMFRLVYSQATEGYFIDLSVMKLPQGRVRTSH